VYTEISKIDGNDTFLGLKAAGAKVDNFNLTLQRMDEQDIFGFQIAMDHSLLSQEKQASQHLSRKPIIRQNYGESVLSNKRKWKSSELVCLY
jgi:hypothetical protein